MRIGFGRREKKTEIEAAIRQGACDVSGKRVNPDVGQPDIPEQQPEQVNVCPQRLKIHQCVVLPILCIEIVQDYRVWESDGCGTEFNP
jgi:hypothetical protein